MKEIIRLCVGCRNLYKIDNLIKIKLFKGQLIVNPKTYFSGRSTYLCYNIECLDKIKRYKKLERSFKNKINIAEPTWNLLEKILKTKKDDLSRFSVISEGK
ncbi:MAG: YlxR family protein [Candidatus Sericytochromatia bacterium]|nr:YlxR family protein [Candidatus Sericytochromatia bacterium]